MFCYNWIDLAFYVCNSPLHIYLMDLRLHSTPVAATHIAAIEFEIFWKVLEYDNGPIPGRSLIVIEMSLADREVSKKTLRAVLHWISHRRPIDNISSWTLKWGYNLTILILSTPQIKMSTP